MTSIRHLILIMSASPASESSSKFQCAGEIERAEQAHLQ